MIWCTGGGRRAAGGARLGGASTQGVTPRIVGGLPAASLKWFPYSVSIRTSDYAHRCGGSIIAPRWILTAGHCVVDGFDGRLEPSDLLVVAGELDLYADTKQANVYKLSRIVLHPKYVDFEEGFLDGHDVALLYLARDLTYSATVQPIKISAALGAPLKVCLLAHYPPPKRKREPLTY
eukprot:jgi/Mesen1/9484/ME000063S08936